MTFSSRKGVEVSSRNMSQTHMLGILCIRYPAANRVLAGAVEHRFQGRDNLMTYQFARLRHSRFTPQLLDPDRYNGIQPSSRHGSGRVFLTCCRVKTPKASRISARVIWLDMTDRKVLHLLETPGTQFVGEIVQLAGLWHLPSPRFVRHISP